MLREQIIALQKYEIKNASLDNLFMALWNSKSVTQIPTWCHKKCTIISLNLLNNRFSSETPRNSRRYDRAHCNIETKSARRSETNAQETEKSICLFVLRHTFHRDLVPGKRAGRIKFQVIGSSSGKVMSVRGVNSITFVRLSSRVSKLSFGASFRECFATTLSNRICTTIQLQGINYFKAKSSAKCRHFQTIPSCWNFAFHEN